jgi:hypothetical protein
VKVQYTGHLGHRPVHLVIHDHERRQFLPQAHLLGAEGDAPIDLVDVVPPLPQAGPLDLGRRRHEEHDQCVGVARPDLTRSLEVDLEDHVLAGRSLGKGCAVEMAEELGPLEEPTGRDLLLETPTIDEGVRVGCFTGTLRTRRPRTAEPEPGVALEQSGDDRAFPRPARAGDDEDQDFDVCVSRASR